MNAPYDMERELAQWMAHVVPSRAPENLAPSIVARTRSIRPRPGWLARLLEPPMQTQLSLRRAFGLGRSPRLVLLGLLVLALATAAVIVGSQLIRQQSLPPPFGLAGNGLVAADVRGKIVVMQADGSDARPLDLPFPYTAGMAFSRDGTKVAAWAADAVLAGESSLVVANADGSGASKVADFSGRIQDGFSAIAWSPDDRRLAFTDATGALYVVDRADSSARPIAPDDSIVMREDPAWAPDGRLAYRCQTGDEVLHLCVAAADLATERILPTSPGTDHAFSRSSWSHDGKQIAYQIDDTTDHPASAPGYDIATIDVATDAERILTRGTADHMIWPVWTPDNRYVLTIGGGIVAADGSGTRFVSDGRCGWVEPSPDGKFLTCIADGPQVELWPIEGGPPTIIPLDGPAEKVAWQRLAP